MQKKQAALSFILITILLDMLGIGIIIPVLPKLVTTLYGSDLSHGSYIFGWFAASYALMQFIFRRFWGTSVMRTDVARLFWLRCLEPDWIIW